MGGAALRNWQNITAVKALGPVAVVAILSRRAPRQQEPPPGITLWQSIHGDDIARQRHLLRKVEKKLWWLRPHGHWWADDFYSSRVARQLQQFIQDFQPDVILLEELWLHRYLPVLTQTCPRLIYDAHNVEVALRQAIERSLTDVKARLEATLLSRKVNAIERRLIRQADQIWTCSHQDAHLIQTLYHRHPSSIRVVPNGIDTTVYAGVRAGEIALPADLSDTYQYLLFVATFSYQPNAKAAEILIQEIFPTVQAAHPKTRLLLVGDAPTPLMRQAARSSAGTITVTGRVVDVRPYLAAATMTVMPLQVGGGTRLKILEAFAAGCPVVTTEKGVEGIKGQPNTHWLQANTTDEIIAAVVQLLVKDELRTRLQQAAYELVQTQYAWQALTPIIQGAVAAGAPVIL